MIPRKLRQQAEYNSYKSRRREVERMVDHILGVQSDQGGHKDTDSYHEKAYAYQAMDMHIGFRGNW